MFWFKVGVGHKHLSCNAIKGNSYRLLNKQKFICSNFLVIVSVYVAMYYEVSKDDFTLRSLLDLRTFKVFQGSYSSPILNHAFDFSLTEKYFEPFWKSGLAKTEPTGPVLPPLMVWICTCMIAICFTPIGVQLISKIRKI